MSTLFQPSTLLLAASLFLAGLALGHRLATEHYKGRLAQAQQAQLANSLRLQKAADSHIRAVEHQQAEQLARISQRYQQELQDAKVKTTRLLADLHRARRLYVPIQSPASHANGVSAAAPAARFRDGETRAELSAAAARFLIGLADEADQAVRQLSACQQVIQADRVGE